MCGAPDTTTIPTATSTGVLGGGTFTCPAIAGTNKLMVRGTAVAVISIYALL